MKKAIFLLAVPFFINTVKAQKKMQFPKFSAEAHRGGMGLMPENTIMAMKNAMTFDAVTTLELDTHISKDGKVVVTHDDYLSPSFMLTPDGAEIPVADAKKYCIYQMDYATIKQFDNGTKVNQRFPEQKKVKNYLPLLGELIDSVENEIKTKKLKRFFYNIETKSNPGQDGVTNPEPEVFVKLVMDVIEAKKIQPYVVIQSFDPRTIRIINDKYPNIRTSFLVANKKSYEENIKELGYKPFILSPLYTMVTEDMLKKAHADGIKVIPWTVDQKTDIDKLKAMGVDGIISNYPNHL